MLPSWSLCGLLHNLSVFPKCIRQGKEPCLCFLLDCCCLHHFIQISNRPDELPCSCLTACLVSGSLKLASLVQYVPLPVVGGYLGYVGYFCLASGVSLASGDCLIVLCLDAATSCTACHEPLGQLLLWRYGAACFWHCSQMSCAACML